ncbi:dynein assembly factor 3 axonemal [Holotrichia oblita]|uniref:Dynein assembly factor 3 axonemal n=1 Tax=Holotrichia oblita TaxID=644536 RepID=A0ACB9T1H6_HOLOL|nr:dynein assembly factor 3 axonemal [Holotrichia oblita]
MFWGLTPALDLQYEIADYSVLSREINILLVGGADCRHVLKTLAKRYCYDNTRLNVYIMEACPETIAKQLLLLYVALQPEEELGLVQKTRYFMELYGNMITRPAVSQYLKQTATGFIDMITDYEVLKRIMPFVTIDVRYKERDYIENLFKFWRGTSSFDIQDCWDKRLRKSLGVRYDNKFGAFDWDLHMRFHNIGGKMVGNQEYQSFRSRGVAFNWLESEASKPNRSMVCGVVPNGNDFLHYGYMGDIMTGPFVAYGLDCKDKSMLRSTNNTCLQRSTDITECNLREIFHEIQTRTEYKHKKMNDLNLGALVTNMNDLKVVDSSADGEPQTKTVKKCIDLPNVKLIFLTINYLSAFEYKEQYHNFFHLIYFNFNYLKYIDWRILAKIAKPHSLLYIENQLFVLSNREKELEKYKMDVMTKLDGLIYSELKFDPVNDQYFKLLINTD